MKTTLLVFAILLSGCASAFQRDEVRITRTPGFLQFGALTGYNVSFPAVALSHAGTTTFKFVHLPAGEYEYYYRATGGSRHGDLAFHRGDRTLAEVHRPRAIVVVKATSLDGKILFQETVPISYLAWDRDGGSAPVPSESPPTSPATDLRLSVTVVTPSTNPKERFQVMGFARER